VIEELLAQARADAASVTEMAAALIRQPSRGGIDPYTPVFAVLEKFLADRGLPHRRLLDADEALVGLVCEISGAHPGPVWVLDACIDTAPFGDEHAWSFAPTVGDVVDGWLRGRGSSDSKIAASMFCHIAAAIAEHREHLHGTLAVLLDADEHTGGFGGAKAFFGSAAGQHAAGVMIGYPGLAEVVVGGRGSWRALVHVHGTAGHSGSSASPDRAGNAVVRAARLVQFLSATGLPPAADGGFPLPGKLTVTQISGGEGFSTVPDHAVVGVDARLTDVFDAAAAEKLLTEAAADLDTTWPAPRPTTVETVTNWPPFHLADSDQPAAALLSAAAAAGLQVRPKVAGPSNIGNYLAGLGIPATAGFGLPYEGLHGTDEKVRLEQLPTVQAIYHQAVLNLLTEPAGED
jgi:succinyl-diaminopimelate desuccinylase